MGDAIEFLKSRLRFPALHRPNRVALARRSALARGTSTHLLVTSTYDPTRMPITAAASRYAVLPRFSFAHIQPEVWPMHARTART
jgi:hypothetical protein